MPTKRDFVALNAQRKFLDPFETWLQSGLASSKNELGEDWQNLFLQAPIWRYWMGKNVCGMNVAGVLMPSVDGIGRYFPLSAFAAAPDGREIVSPFTNAEDEWYSATENLLLQTLEEGFNDTPEQLIAKMGKPALEADNRAAGISKSVTGGIVAVPGPNQTLATLFSFLAENQARNALASLSFWWTTGSTDIGPRAMVFDGMPDVSMFSALLNPEALPEKLPEKLSESDR